MKALLSAVPAVLKALLKAALKSAPVLRVWDPERPTRLLTEASELAVSLSSQTSSPTSSREQPEYAGPFHPAAFKSRKLTVNPAGALVPAPPGQYL